MLTFPCGGAYDGTVFCKVVFEVVNIFGVGMTVEVVHNFRYHDGVDSLSDGRDRGSARHFSCLIFLVVNYHC